MRMIENVLCLVLGTAIAVLGLSVIYFGFAQLTILPVTWFLWILGCVIGWVVFLWGVEILNKLNN